MPSTTRDTTTKPSAFMPFINLLSTTLPRGVQHVLHGPRAGGLTVHVYIHLFPRASALGGRSATLGPRACDTDWDYPQMLFEMVIMPFLDAEIMPPPIRAIMPELCRRRKLCRNSAALKRAQNFLNAARGASWRRPLALATRSSIANHDLSGYCGSVCCTNSREIQYGTE